MSDVSEGSATPAPGTDSLEAAALQIDAFLNPKPQGQSEAEAEPEAEAEAQPEREAPQEASDADEEPADAETEEAEAADEKPETSEAETEEPESYTVKVDGKEVKVTLDELRRGYSRQEDYSRKTAALADQRREFDSLVQATKEEQLRRLSEAELLFSELEVATGNQEPDWERLRNELLPDEYLMRRDEWDRRQAARGKYREALSQHQQKIQAERQQEFQAVVADNAKRIAEEWPEYADPQTRGQALESLFGFLEESGFSRQEAMNLYDARQVRMIRDAMAYRNSQKKTKEVIEKKVTPKPKMGKPGAKQEPRDRKGEDVARSIKRAQRAPTRDNIADAWEKFLNR